MTHSLPSTAPSDIDSEDIDQYDDEYLDCDMDNIIEGLESAVIDRISDAMTAWSELHQPEGVEAGRQDYVTYFCGGDWKVYVDEPRYVDHDTTDYDFTMGVEDADGTSIEAIASRVITYLEERAGDMLTLLNEVGEDIHEIDDISLEASVVLTLQVLDASPIVDYDDGTYDFVSMPTGGVRVGVRARLETSNYLEGELRAAQKVRDSKR